MRHASPLVWTSWVPLLEAHKDPVIPRLPGLYRIRRCGRTDLDYIGQTGMPLPKRIAMLRAIVAEEMPYRAPHTAAPALWGLHHATGCSFEISVAPVAGSVAWRKGLEALAIAQYRQEHRQSPTVAFGRMPSGYVPSTGNNARLVRLGLRLRGGPTEENHPSHVPGIPPVGLLTGHPQGARWGGHRWSAWIALGSPWMNEVDGVGLYRIRGDAPDRLLYIGQGRIPDRPLVHYAKCRQPDDAQGMILRQKQRLEVSWVLGADWLPHQRLELENDLIGAHLLVTGAPPPIQFLG
jgi:hypothetical protein